MRGRPTKLTPELQQQICAVIVKGNYIITACQAVGISQMTYERWMARGAESKTGLFVDFVEAIKRAEAEAEANRVARIEAAGIGGQVVTRTTTTRRFKDGTEQVTVTEAFTAPQWTADAWLLERKNPDRWGRRERVEHDVGANLQNLLLELKTNRSKA